MNFPQPGIREIPDLDAEAARLAADRQAGRNATPVRAGDLIRVIGGSGVVTAIEVGEDLIVITVERRDA